MTFVLNLYIEFVAKCVFVDHNSIHNCFTIFKEWSEERGKNKEGDEREGVNNPRINTN